MAPPIAGALLAAASDAAAGRLQAPEGLVEAGARACARACAASIACERARARAHASASIARARALARMRARASRARARACEREHCVRASRAHSHAGASIKRARAHSSHASAPSASARAYARACASTARERARACEAVGAALRAAGAEDFALEAAGALLQEVFASAREAWEERAGAEAAMAAAVLCALSRAEARRFDAARAEAAERWDIALAVAVTQREERGARRWGRPQAAAGPPRSSADRPRWVEHVMLRSGGPRGRDCHAKGRWPTDHRHPLTPLAVFRLERANTKTEIDPDRRWIGPSLADIEPTSVERAQPSPWRRRVVVGETHRCRRAPRCHACPDVFPATDPPGTVSGRTSGRERGGTSRSAKGYTCSQGFLSEARFVRACDTNRGK